MDSMYAICATHKSNVVHAAKTIRERDINMQYGLQESKNENVEVMSDSNRIALSNKKP